MAKYKVLLSFKDNELGKIHNIGDEVDYTVKRADEINAKLSNLGVFLERVEKDKEDTKEDK